MPRDRTVEVLTVDELCARLDFVPTYLKADLEGFEPGMIGGHGRRFVGTSRASP